MKFLIRVIPILLIIVLSYLTLSPFFIPGVFPIHDDTQVVRVYEMAQSLRDGMFPVRWVADLGYGYGYPIFNFYAPLAYYIGGIASFFVPSVISATKLMMGIGITLSGLAMYVYARELWGRNGGIIAATLYLFAPYHAVNIYVRGDVAEYFAYAFYPLVLLGVYKIITAGSRKYRWIVLTAVSYACVILSHNLSAVMFTPFLILYVLFLSGQIPAEKRLQAISPSGLAAVLGIGLAAFYWLPVLFEMKYTNVLSQVGGGANFHDHFVCFSQLWQSQWGFGGSVPGCTDGLSFMLGKIHIVLSVVAVTLFILWGKRNTIAQRHAPFFLFAFLLSIILMLSLSVSIWETLPFMSFLQYPWRFLGIAVLFLSLLGGSIAVFFKNHTHPTAQVGILCAMLFIVIYTNNDFFTPQTILGKKDVDIINETSLKWTASKISDEYMPVLFKKPTDSSQIVQEKFVLEGNVGSIVSSITETDTIAADILLSETGTLRIYTAYFPSWKLTVNGVTTPYAVTDQGLMIRLPAGQHRVILQYEQTGPQKLGNSISAISILLLGIGIINKRKQLFHSAKTT
jgi:hypothetical protein